MSFHTQPRIKHQHSQGMFQYVPYPMPKPGTQNLIFETNFTNPVFGIANGILTKKSMLAITTMNPLISVPRVVLNGIGGQLAGNLSFSPLLDNEGGS